MLDLTTEDENGKKWDLSDLKTQNEIEVRLRQESPWLLALSLPSTVFATVRSLNSTRQNDKLMVRRKVTAHISFAVKLCVMQSKSGRKFLIEQPVGTRAWGTQLMNKLLFEKGVGKVNFDFDMCEMKSAKEREVWRGRGRASATRERCSRSWRSTRQVEDTNTSRRGSGKPHATCTTTSSAKPCARP